MPLPHEYIPLVDLTDEEVAERSVHLFEMIGMVRDPVKRQRLSVWQEECETELERRGL
jgi:hypothetical protein